MNKKQEDEKAVENTLEDTIAGIEKQHGDECHTKHMKNCTQCGKRKKLSSFYADINQNDGRKDECKSCNVIRSLRYYRKNKSHILACAKAYAQTHKPQMSAIRKRGKARKYALVVQAKSKPCMDCGKTFPLCVMDLDHVRGKKCFALSALGTRARVRIRKEIAKCEAVCSNCHRIRTWSRRMKRKP